jgi:hypothetical protein
MVRNGSIMVWIHSFYLLRNYSCTTYCSVSAQSRLQWLMRWSMARWIRCSSEWRQNGQCPIGVWYSYGKNLWWIIKMVRRLDQKPSRNSSNCGVVLLVAFFRIPTSAYSIVFPSQITHTFTSEREHAELSREKTFTMVMVTTVSTLN